MLQGFFGAPAGARTPNLLIRSQTLYPIELRARILYIYMRSRLYATTLLFYTNDVTNVKSLNDDTKH